MARRSIGLPLTLGIVLVVLAVALAVGWHVLVVFDPAPVAAGLTSLHWTLLILGSLFFLLLIVGLLLLIAWLVREIRFAQRQQAFLDAVTHELRTPLASLRLYLDTLLRHDPDPERRRAFLARMGDDLERLGTVVDEVLAAARAEARIQRVRQEAVDLGGLLARSAAETRRRHHLPEDAVTLAVPEGIRVRGDTAELALCFRTLLDNAVRYSAGEVEVRIAVAFRGDDRVEVVIEDRGIGIPPRELRKIFRRFYRVGREVQRQAAGLGLGLYVVRSLLRHHGARVSAESEGIGRGSRFRVNLRLADEALPRARPLREASREAAWPAS